MVLDYFQDTRIYEYIQKLPMNINLYSWEITQKNPWIYRETLLRPPQYAEETYNNNIFLKLQKIL